jgi:ATP phosphoribosyltransferase
VWEKAKDVVEVQNLGFAGCKMSLAVPKDAPYNGLEYFKNKKIATSYPKILQTYFATNNITVEIEEIGGSVEIAPGIGLADGIFDIVSSGSTLLMNGLKEVEIVKRSSAVLIANKNLTTEKNAILDKLLFRIKAVLAAQENKYILLNAPNTAIEAIIKMLPGVKSPTILPLAEAGWSSIHSVVKEDDFWTVIDNLKTLGAEGILVVPIEKMIQ